MSDDTIYTLVPSTNRGRYALDDPEHGHDLTSGEPIAILLGGQWLEGRIEHSDLFCGYYFIASSDGAVCGLCTGMQVRLISARRNV